MAEKKHQTRYRPGARNRYDVDESLESPFSWENLKSCFAYIKRVRKSMTIALLLSVFSSIAVLSGPLIMQKGIDEAIPAGDITGLIFLSALLLGTLLVSFVLNSIRMVIVARASQTIVFDIRQDLFNHLQVLSFSYFDNRPHGKILVRVINYVDEVSNVLTNGILNLIIEMINIMVILIFMFRLNAPLACLIVAGVPVVAAFVWTIKPKQRRAWQQVSNKNSNLNAFVQESIQGVRVTQAFNRQKINLETQKRLAAERRRAWMSMIYTSYSIPFITETVSQLVFSFMYVMGVYWLYPMASFGVLLAMSSYTSRFWQPIINLANIYNTFINAIAYLERIFETINEPVEICERTDAKELSVIRGKVEFDHVSFSYNEKQMVLNDISFTINPGESVAIVGPTGAGKTTIVNLLSRFYDTDDGEIRIDGQNIANVTLHSLRSQMGIMLQDSFLFSGTIADNIRYGRLDASDEEIRNVARLLNADAFISRLPKGYDTEVNERGSSLSQGEKQLIAFARTLLSNPAILILDEATSSIDTGTERLLQEGIRLLLKGRTSFIIAHRLSTIRDCDRILYIDHGQIIESGTHESLMNKRGQYWKLYMSQYSEDIPA